MEQDDIGDFLDLLNKRGKYRETSNDIYQELLSKEARVLETVDRVVNTTRDKDVQSSSILNLSVHEIWTRLLTLVPLLLNESLNIKKLSDLKDIFLKEDRKIYVGIIIIFISFIAFLCTVI